MSDTVELDRMKLEYIQKTFAFVQEVLKRQEATALYLTSTHTMPGVVRTSQPPDAVPCLPPPMMVKWLATLCELKRTRQHEATLGSFERPIASWKFWNRYYEWVEATYGGAEAIERMTDLQCNRELRDICCAGLPCKKTGKSFTAGGVKFWRANGVGMYSFDFGALTAHLQRLYPPCLQRPFSAASYHMPAQTTMDQE